MILSEKELEKIIRSVPSIGPYHAGAGEAARLIAEKMAEGVVAKIDGRWTTDDLGYHVLTVDSHSNWEGQKIRMATVMQGQLENYYGQRVTVTVSFYDPYHEEEGDGQEVD